MWRYLAGAAACFLMLTGAFLLWQGRAQDVSPIEPAPRPLPAGQSILAPRTMLDAPEASPKSREEKRFSRADKDRSGWLSPVEYATTAPPPPAKKRCGC